MSQSASNDKTGQLGRLDEEFVKIMTEIEKRYSNFSKHERIRIEQWSKKLCQVSVNTIWKQNRNLYAYLLLDCILNKSLKEPFNKIPPEDYLPSLNKHIIKSKIEALQDKLNRNEMLVENDYQSPEKGRKHQRVVSMSTQNVQPRAETRKSFPVIEDPNPLDSFSTTSFMNYFGSPKDSKQLPSDRTNPRSKDERLRSSNTKYTEDDLRDLQDSENRDIEKMQEQLEKAQLTIDNLKDELNARFKTVSQLNQKVEKLTSEAQDFEKGRNMFEIFLENLKTSIRRGHISFQSEAIGDDFINHLNDLCEALSMTKLKQKNNLRGGASLSKILEELPVKEKTVLVERKRVGSSDNVGGKKYYENADSSQGLNKHYKDLTCDTKSLQKPSVLHAKGPIIGPSISYRNNTKKSDSEYINIYHHTEK